MNKTEYLSALKEALKDTDESVMEEIVLDYEEHFQIGMENGKGEEQICVELGAIDDLVKEIKEAYHTNHSEEKSEESKVEDSEENKEEKEDNKSFDEQANNKNIFKDWYSNIHSIDGEKLGDAINNALDSAGDAISKIDVNEISRTLKSTLDQATSSINNFADSYLKNQGSPFDFGKRGAEGYKDNVSKSYASSEESEESGEQNFSYDMNTEDASKNESAENGKPEAVNTDSEAETLNNKAEATDKVTESADSGDDSADLGKGSEETVNQSQKSEDVNTDNTNKGLNLTVDGICADITVEKSTNGKINVSYENNGNERQRQMYEFYSYKEGNTVYAGIRRVGKAVFLFNAKLYSMNIYVEIPEDTGNVNVKTASGNIKISNVNADSIIATTASGDVVIDGVYTTDFRIKVSSGDISLDDVNCVQLRAGATSGDIEANNIETKFLSLRSSSGDIEIGNIKADIVDCSPLSGDLEIVNMKAGECKVRSSSGDIEIRDFTMNNADVSSISGDIRMIQVVGDGLRVNSGSGDVTAEVNVKRCHASSKSGDAEVTCNGDVTLESSSTSGSINITLKNYKNGYNVKSRTTSGSLYIDYDNIHQRNQKSGSYTYGSQGSELILSTVSGDIHLTD